VLPLFYDSEPRRIENIEAEEPVTNRINSLMVTGTPNLFCAPNRLPPEPKRRKCAVLLSYD
jgi:hypothetical protein